MSDLYQHCETILTDLENADKHYFDNKVVVAFKLTHNQLSMSIKPDKKTNNPFFILFEVIELDSTNNNYVCDLPLPNNTQVFFESGSTCQIESIYTKNFEEEENESESTHAVTIAKSDNGGEILVRLKSRQHESLVYNLLFAIQPVGNLVFLPPELHKQLSLMPADFMKAGDLKCENNDTFEIMSLKQYHNLIKTQAENFRECETILNKCNFCFAKLLYGKLLDEKAQSMWENMIDCEKSIIPKSISAHDAAKLKVLLENIADLHDKLCTARVSLELQELPEDWVKMREAYARWLENSSWDRVSPSDRNLTHLVDVRAQVIGLRCLETALQAHIMGHKIESCSEALDKGILTYEQSSLRHQIEQIKANNCLNTILLSENVYNDVQAVTKSAFQTHTQLPELKNLKEMFTTPDELCFAAQAIVRGMLWQSKTSVKLKNKNLDKNLQIKHSYGTSQNTAVDILMRKIHTDAQNRIISPQIKSHVDKIMSRLQSNQHHEDDYLSLNSLCDDHVKPLVAAAFGKPAPSKYTDFLDTSSHGYDLDKLKELNIKLIKLDLMA